MLREQHTTFSNDADPGGGKPSTDFWLGLLPDLSHGGDGHDDQGRLDPDGAAHRLIQRLGEHRHGYRGTCKRRVVFDVGE